MLIHLIASVAGTVDSYKFPEWILDERAKWYVVHWYLLNTICSFCYHCVLFMYFLIVWRTLVHILEIRDLKDFDSTIYIWKHFNMLSLDIMKRITWKLWGKIVNFYQKQYKKETLCMQKKTCNFQMSWELKSSFFL